MQIDGEYEVPADVDTVWQSLNDPEVLKLCIKGCESIEKYQILNLLPKSPVRSVQSKLSLMSILNLLTLSRRINTP